MTVNTVSSVAEFVTNGVTTNFPFYFKFLANGDLVVTYVDPLGVSSILTLGTHYTVSGAGNDQGGSVITTTALAGPGQLVVSREMEAFQQTSLRNQGKFLAETHEDVFDKLTMLIQQGLAIFTRALKRPFGREYFFAENRRIAGVKDPVEAQDAATRAWSEKFIADILETGQGPINNAANVVYVYPDNTPHTVQSLSGEDGASGVGYQTGSVADKLESIDGDISSVSSQLIAQKKRVSGYLSVTPVDNAISFNLNNASTVGVNISQQINTVTMAGAVAGERYSVDLIFSQGSISYAVTLPTSVKRPAGVTSLVSTAPYSITLISLSTTDGGVTWLVRHAVIYDNTPTPVFPVISNMNSSFNSEGDSTAAFTATNSTMSVASSYLRCTKITGGALSKISAPVTFTPANSDYIFYGKVRVRNDANSVATIWFLNGSKEVSIWFGSSIAGSASTPGAISICGTTGTSTRNVASAGTGYAYHTDPVEFALQFDNKFSSLTCWIKQTDGTWGMAARVACDYFSATSIEILNGTLGTAGAWIEFDYLTLCRPNIVMLSDSIGEGKTLFSPNLSLALNNFQSTWMAHAPVPAYLGQRNNLIVNKGVGGQDSATIAARAAVDCAGARVVFLHASSNDVAAGIAQAARKTNIQNTINTIAGLGGSTILLNASYGTQSGSDNATSSALRNYMKLSWESYLPTLTGVSAFVNIMTPVLDSDGFLSTAYAADGIHPNIAGHTSIGAFIAKSQ